MSLTRQDVLESMTCLLKWQTAQNCSLQSIIEKLAALETGDSVRFPGTDIPEKYRWLIPAGKQVQKDVFYDKYSFKQYFRISQNVTLAHIKHELLLLQKLVDCN